MERLSQQRTLSCRKAVELLGRLFAITRRAQGYFPWSYGAIGEGRAFRLYQEIHFSQSS